MNGVNLPAAIRLVRADNVCALDPAPAMFDAMLQGWEQQQRRRLLARKTVSGRLSLVRRFAEFTGTCPWDWTPEDVEAYFSTRLSRGEVVWSTVRGQQSDLEMFCSFITDSRYGWAKACLEEFGRFPVQVCHDWNTAQHVADFEGRPGRRAFTYDELQTLFDAADDRVEQIRKRGRKGALTAWRDSVLVKQVYAYGTRRRETSMLDLPDLRHNPRAAQYERLGAVRCGLSPGRHPALWVSERRGRLGVRRLDEVFVAIREHPDLPDELDLHYLCTPTSRT
ncbi:phage integrase N-terminal SAM-like domain-containing protein [Streptomyces sp. NPDC050844]|uniref:phage integrase N-terminal SAM-like domain-containing protein n=1 Tax=Streptomyces sp. NPDC050844 TaxID=3155790 RepID=UPI0033D18796